MKKALLALPLAALLLAGCSTTAPTVTPAGEAIGAAQPAAAAAPADRSAALGDTVNFESGAAVTVTSTGYKPAGKYASGAIEGQGATFELTITNTGTEDLNGAIMSLAKVTYGAKNVKAETVIDSANGLGFGVMSTILPGESQTVSFAVAIPAAEAGAVRVEVAGPKMFRGKPAIFKGAIA